MTDQNNPVIWIGNMYTKRGSDGRYHVYIAGGFPPIADFENESTARMYMSDKLKEEPAA